MHGWMEKTVSILLNNIDSLKQFFSEIKVIFAITMLAGRLGGPSKLPRMAHLNIRSPESSRNIMYRRFDHIFTFTYQSENN